MGTINQLITAFIVLIEAGGICRIGKLIIDIMGDPDSAGANGKKIKNVIIFMALALMIAGLKEIIVKYYELIVV